MKNLYEHNEEIYNEITYYLNSNSNKKYKRVGIIQDTGLGKTYVSIKLIHDYFTNSKVLYVAPTNALLHNISLYDYWENNDRITMTTYSNLKNIDNAYDVIILDEFHRAGAKVWNKYVMEKINAIPITIGLTATPIRYLDNRKDMRYLFDKIIQGLTLEDAVERGIVKPFEKYVTSYFLNILNEKDKDKINKIRKTLGVGKVIERNMSIENIIKQNDPNYSKRKWIIFFSRIDDMEKFDNNICNWFDIDKSQIVQISSRQNSNKNNAILDKFKKDPNIRVMKCCNMFNEGIHIDNVTGVIFLRKTISPIVYKQQLGRVVNIGEKNNPIVFDLVGNIHSVSNTLNEKCNVYNIKNKCYKNHSYINGIIKKIFLNVYDYTIEVDDVLSSIYSSHIKWSKEEDEIVMSAKSCDDAYDKLKKLGYDRTKCAIFTRKNRLTDVHVRRIRWSKEEDDIMMSAKSCDDAYDKLKRQGYDRTKPAISARKHKLTGNGYTVSHIKWSKEEDEIVMSAKSQSDAYDKLKKFGYDRTKPAIYARKYKLTGNGYTVSHIKWSKEEDEIVMSTKSYDDAYDKLKKLGYDRTKHAIGMRKCKLTGNMYNAPCIRWSKEEDDIVMSAKSQSDAYDKLKRQGYDRTKPAISARKHKLTGNGYTVLRTKWSKEEDDIVMSAKSYDDACDKLKKLGYDRTKHAIGMRKCKLTGNMYNAPCIRWSKEEDDIVMSAKSQSDAYDKLKKLGYDRTKHAIGMRKCKLTNSLHSTPYTG